MSRRVKFSMRPEGLNTHHLHYFTALEPKLMKQNNALSTENFNKEIWTRSWLYFIIKSDLGQIRECLLLLYIFYGGFLDCVEVVDFKHFISIFIHIYKYVYIINYKLDIIKLYIMTY